MQFLFSRQKLALQVQNRNEHWWCLVTWVEPVRVLRCRELGSCVCSRSCQVHWQVGIGDKRYQCNCSFANCLTLSICQLTLCTHAVTADKVEKVRGGHLRHGAVSIWSSRLAVNSVRFLQLIVSIVRATFFSVQRHHLTVDSESEKKQPRTVGLIGQTNVSSSKVSLAFG